MRDTLTIPQGNNVSGRAGELRERHTASQGKSLGATQHLLRVLTEYSRHYNEHRPHQSREQRPPLHEPGQAVDMTARIKRTHVVWGLISEYRRAA